MDQIKFCILVVVAVLFLIPMIYAVGLHGIGYTNGTVESNIGCDNDIKFGKVFIGNGINILAFIDLAFFEEGIEFEDVGLHCFCDCHSFDSFLVVAVLILGVIVVCRDGSFRRW